MADFDFNAVQLWVLLSGASCLDEARHALIARENAKAARRFQNGPQVEAKPNTLPLAADDFARGARFAARHMGATRPTIAPLLDAAARHRAEGEELGRAQAAEVLERVLAKLAEKGSPADLDCLRQVREHVAAELGRVGRGCVVGGEGE